MAASGRSNGRRSWFLDNFFLARPVAHSRGLGSLRLADADWPGIFGMLVELEELWVMLIPALSSRSRNNFLGRAFRLGEVAQQIVVNAATIRSSAPVRNADTEYPRSRTRREQIRPR